MSSIGMFNGESIYTLDGTETYIESSLIQPPGDPETWQGLDAFCASITAGPTVTPTIYFHYGNGVYGEGHTIYSNASTPATSFTSAAKFECRVWKEDRFTPCEGWKIRFTIASNAAGAVLTASASVK